MRLYTAPRLNSEKGVHLPSNEAITSNELVAALYQSLLLRDGDNSGVADKSARLDAGKIDVAGLIREFMKSSEFLERLPEILYASGHSGGQRFTNDVSQYGEIWELLKLMTRDGGTQPVVVDVGARGRERSNSYDLLRHFGWSGFLVEANSALIDQINSEFADLDMTCVCCAVSDYDGIATLTLGVNADVSSLTEGNALDWGPSPGTVTVTVRRLPDLLDEAGIGHDIGLLSLDIEGEDIKVLNDLIGNSQYRPRYIIIEASNDFKVTSLDDAPFSAAVKDLYQIRAQTRANLILSRITR